MGRHLQLLLAGGLLLAGVVGVSQQPLQGQRNTSPTMAGGIQELGSVASGA